MTVFSVKVKIVFVSAVLATTFCGCGYMKMVFDTWQTEHRYTAQPSQLALKRIAPEKCRAVYGVVKGAVAVGTPMLIVAVSEEYGQEEIVDIYRTDGPGHYSLFLPSGEYRVDLFADLDGDSLLTAVERIGGYSDGAVLAVNPPDSVEKVLPGIDISGDTAAVSAVRYELNVRVGAEKPRVSSKYYPPGAIRELDDDIFSAQMAQLGMYSPAAFLARAGLYFYAVNERDMRKTPVVFVHGMGGSPREFAYVIENIDRQRFDPWFFYYPSGVQIEKLGEIFYEIFLSGRIIDMRNRTLVIVAHSMGGLVVRSAINQYVATSDDHFLRLLVTMSTPYGGNDAASAGLEQAPVVVPSWRDIAAGSSFLGRLYQVPLPPQLDFRLMFTYRNRGNMKMGENSDETITLRSQLDEHVQSAATQVRGFNETHTSVLTSADAVGYLNSALASVRDRAIRP